MPDQRWRPAWALCVPQLTPAPHLCGGDTFFVSMATLHLEAGAAASQGQGAVGAECGGVVGGPAAAARWVKATAAQVKLFRALVLLRGGVLEAGEATREPGKVGSS